MAQCTPKSFDLTGKVALITGASYGIGMAIAKAMAANGATIVFNDIKQELVDKGVIRGGTAGDLELRHSDAKAAVLVKRALEAEDPIYRTIDDVPAWGRPYVQALIDRGTLEGEEAPVNGVRILNIRYSAVRLIKMLAEEPVSAE